MPLLYFIPVALVTLFAGGIWASQLEPQIEEQHFGAPAIQVFQGGTGSSTLTGILNGNATSSVRTTELGAGLSLSGTTLSITCENITGLSSDLCDGSDASGAGGSSAFEIATTSDLGISQLAYITKTSGRTTLGSVATGTVSAGAGISLDSATRSVIGGALAISATLGTAITSNEITDDEIVNADINSAAAISVSKTALTAGDHITLTANDLDVDDDFLLNTGDTGTGLYTLTYASTTAFSSPYASSTSLFAGALTISPSGTITIGGDSLSELVGDGFENSAGTLIFDCSDVASTGLQCSGEDLQLNATGDWTGTFDGVEGADYTLESRQLTIAGTANQITSSAGAQNLTADRTWTLSLPNHVIFPSSFVASMGSTTNATSTNLTVTTLASTTALRISNVPNALVLTSSGGLVGAYGGIDCTNQFVRDVSTTGAGTCATVGAADVSLANLSATDSTLTFSGTYTGATARTIGINLGNANSWTARQTFTYASSTSLSSTGAAYFGTSAGQLTIGTSTPWATLAVNPIAGGAANRFVVGSSTLTSFVINNRGFAGIGTTSPYSAFTLDRVAGTSLATSSITVTEYKRATSTSMTINANDSNTQLLQIGTAATTITLTGFVPGKQLKLIVCNPNGTGGTITWATSPTGILLWAGGTTPTQTTTANKCDVWSFVGTNATSTTAANTHRIFGAMSANF